MSKITQMFTMMLLVLAGFQVEVAHADSSSKLFDLHGVDATNRDKIEQFLATVEAKLPPKIKYALTHNIISNSSGHSSNSPAKPLIVEFGWVAGESMIIHSPLCDQVDRMEIAQARVQEWNAAQRYNSGTKGFRFDGETQIQVVSDSKSTPYGKKLILNHNLLAAIVAGPKSLPDFNCGHQTYYRLAQAAVIHGATRIYDEIGIAISNSQNSQNTSNSLQNRKAETQTLISETDRYRNMTFGWKGSSGHYQTAMGYWPRSVTAYEYAGDVRTHLAFNLEYYLLDAEYGCRKPVLAKYFSEVFAQNGQPYQPNYDQPSKCQVNTTIFLQFRNKLTDNTFYVGNGEINISPDRVREVDYYRASVGNDASSMFGHSMYKISVCRPNTSSEVCEQSKKLDLIVNPRANPMEMHLDQLRGVFGGYPSQFFISRYQDIFGEYAQSELRHLFSFPLGHTNNGHFSQINDEEKRSFVMSTLEYYWEYIGVYKFITNNCANETLNLYKSAFNNPDINDEDIMTPKGVSKLMCSKGVIEKGICNEVKEPGLLSHLPGALGRFFWSDKDQKEQREAIQKDSEHIDEALLFDMQDKIADIFSREHNGQKLADFKDIDGEMAKWAKLATVSDKSKAYCKTAQQYPDEKKKADELARRVDELTSRYRRLYDTAKTRFQQTGSADDHDQMKIINDDFLSIVTYMLDKRTKDFADMAVSIGYEIADPDNGKKTLCGKNGFPVSDAQKKTIQDILKEYTETQYAVLPFDSKLGASPNYGIPLYSETVRGRNDGPEKLKLVMEKQDQISTTLVNTVGPYLGMDYNLLQALAKTKISLMTENCTDRLDVLGGTAFYCNQVEDEKTKSPFL